MDTLIHVCVGLHIIGIAALLGGFVTQFRVMGSGANGSGAFRFAPGMLYGALTMLVTGVAMVGLLHANDESPDNAKMAVKLAVLVVILALVYVKRDEERLDPRMFGAVGALTATNIFIAVLWT